MVELVKFRYLLAFKILTRIWVKTLKISQTYLHEPPNILQKKWLKKLFISVLFNFNE